MVNQVRVFEPFCFLCVSVSVLSCVCVCAFEEVVCVRVKNFRFRFRFSVCRVKNEPTTTLMTFDKAQKYKKRTKKNHVF